MQHFVWRHRTIENISSPKSLLKLERGVSNQKIGLYKNQPEQLHWDTLHYEIEKETLSAFCS